jgi:hypothetical protein
MSIETAHAPGESRPPQPPTPGPIPYGSHVRVRFVGTGCPGHDNVLVERKVAAAWTRVAAFNTMSNDGAQEDAYRVAERTQQQMVAQGFTN